MPRTKQIARKNKTSLQSLSSASSTADANDVVYVVDASTQTVVEETLTKGKEKKRNQLTTRLLLEHLTQEEKEEYQGLCQQRISLTTSIQSVQKQINQFMSQKRRSQILHAKQMIQQNKRLKHLQFDDHPPSSSSPSLEEIPHVQDDADADADQVFDDDVDLFDDDYEDILSSSTEHHEPQP